MGEFGRRRLCVGAIPSVAVLLVLAGTSAPSAQVFKPRSNPPTVEETKCQADYKTCQETCAKQGKTKDTPAGKICFNNCDPVLIDCFNAADKKAAEEKKKKDAEAEKKKKEEAEARKKKEEAEAKKREEAKKQADANPAAGLKFECVADKKGADYVILVYGENTSDFARICNVYCNLTSSDKNAKRRGCSGLELAAHSKRDKRCTIAANAQLGPGPYTNVALTNVSCK